MLSNVLCKQTNACLFVDELSILHHLIDRYCRPYAIDQDGFYMENEGDVPNNQSVTQCGQSIYISMGGLTEREPGMDLVLTGDEKLLNFSFRVLLNRWIMEKVVSETPVEIMLVIIKVTVSLYCSYSFRCC